MNGLTAVNTTPSDALVDSLCWKESPSVKKLLDAVAHIIASEFTTTVKEHPEVFTSIKE